MSNLKFAFHASIGREASRTTCGRRRRRRSAIISDFVAFSSYFQNVAGQVFVFFALTVAAAEVAVGLAIIIALYRSKTTINVDEFQLLKW